MMTAELAELNAKLMKAEGEGPRMRSIETHHDGHGLAESILILAGVSGAGGASHYYHVVMPDIDGIPMQVAEIRFQEGPRNEEGSKPGIIDSVLLAIVADRMECFQKGTFPSRENALILTKTQEAMQWLKHRADERARRNVLGKSEK